MGGGRRKKGRNKSSSLEHKLILHYLQDYKERAISLYNSTLSSSPPKQKHKLTQSYSRSILPTTIDGVQLPSLENLELLKQPFLALPKELTSYHRSIVHDICTDTVHLFHSGVDGATEGERFVAVSIYSDGLNHIPGIGATNSLQVENYRPWIMKKDVDSALETEKGKKMIWELIDQPGRCLRDTCDTIDLLQSKYDNLASIKPPELGDTTCLLVDSAERMQQCIQELEDHKPTEIAFDLECYNRRKDHQMTCLIQLATNDGRTYIIDVLGGNRGEVWDRVHGLAKVFADRSIVKIGHGIRGLDVQSLQRDFGIFVVNAFDTFEAANTLKLEGKGLAALCAHYGLQTSELYSDLKRDYQNTNWTHRPLTGPMILYGRYDVHYLIHLRRLMMRDLITSTRIADSPEFVQQQHAESATSASSSLQDMIRAFNEEDGIEEENLSRNITDTSFENSNNANGSSQVGTPGTSEEFFSAKDLRMNLSLMQVISKSQEACLKLWSSTPEPPLKNKQFVLLAKQCKKDGRDLTKSQLSLYHKLASWREDVGKEEESLPGMVCSLDYLARVAVHRPLTENGLLQINFDIPRIFLKHDRRYMKTIFSFVRDSLADDNIVGEEMYPTFEEFKEKKKKMETYASVNDIIISNPMFWAVSCTTISMLIFGFIAGRKRRS